MLFFILFFLKSVNAKHDDLVSAATLKLICNIFWLL